MHTTHRLTLLIFVALVAGVVAGHVCHAAFDFLEQQQEVAGYFSLVSELFLRLIKMIIAPLVFATLVAGIAQMGQGSTVGRIAIRTLAWFVVAGLVSLLLGCTMANLLEPGVGAGLALPAGEHAGPGVKASFDLRAFITGIVPRSIFEAMATNEVLQIVVFSLFAGVALAAIGERGVPLLRGVEALVHLMLKVTDYVMRAAPLAIFAAVAAVVTTQGLGVLLTFGRFIASFYFSLAILWAVLLLAAAVVLGRSTGQVISAIREPLVLGFATASSEATYPKTLEQLQRIGVPGRIAGFVLPLGYSFNLDGSMMYCAFALLFIAQVYGIDLSIGQQVTMLLLLMIMSKGLAGVPRASLVVIAAALPQLGLPEAGLLLILGIDQFLDMGRTATNVVGNSVATAVVARWEGVQLGKPQA